MSTPRRPAPRSSGAPMIAARMPRGLPQRLLEPVVGERLRVERRDLAGAGRAVEADRRGEVAVGLQPGDTGAAVGGLRLELSEQPATEAEAARRGRDPHALDVRRAAGPMLDGAAADRLRAQIRDQHDARRRAQLLRLGGDSARRVVVGVVAAELGEIGAQALADVGMGGIDRPDLDQGGGEEPLDVAHRAEQPLALRAVERREDRAREVVAALVQQRAFGAARRRELRRSHAPIGGAGAHLDQAVGLERAQQPAGVPGVELEARAQRAHLAAVLAYLQRTRASPSGRSRARYWSLSAPTRWVTARLKRRTCSISACIV